MLDREQLLQLMKVVTRANSSAPTSYSWNNKSFSYKSLNETLRKQLNELAGTYNQYCENKYKIFSLIQETIDDVLPEKVKPAYEQFAEIKFVKQGDKILFTRKTTSNTRAKQFITRVGLAGVYETFKLSPSKETFSVPTSAAGGAAQIGFEEFLDGRVDWAEVVNIVLDGIDELLYEEMAAAMTASINQLPPANRVVTNDFNEAAFDRLITVASAYGEPTIYCTYEFAVKMVPKDAWKYTEAMKDELNRTGRLANYKGKKVVILPQGFKDGTNSEKVIDASYCWIIPNGADNRPIKVAFEGDTIVDEYVNRDRSREIQVYKKFGVVAMLANNICSYRDTSLSNMSTWNLNYNAANNVTVISG